MNRLTAALIAYGVLGILTYLTISDSRIRNVTFAILALFAVKTLLRRNERNESMLPDVEEAESGEGKDLADSR